MIIIVIPEPIASKTIPIINTSMLKNVYLNIEENIIKMRPK